MTDVLLTANLSSFRTATYNTAEHVQGRAGVYLYCHFFSNGLEFHRDILQLNVMLLPRLYAMLQIN